MIFAWIGIILIVASLLLVTFNVLRDKWYAWLIYFAGLFTAYGTTMVGMSVVGSDISRELLMSNLALQNGWDLTLYDPSNTSVLVGWIIPQLSRLTTIEPVWIYKAVLPMIFAFTPVILYFIFRKQFGELKAFYASMFFIVVPVFALEIASIGKSMVAETLMALTLWVIFNMSRGKNLKGVVILLLGILTLWVHYTVGIILCIYLVGLCAYWAFICIFNKSERSRCFTNIISMCMILGIVGVLFFVYYSNVAQGLIWNSVSGIALHHGYSQSMAIIQDSVAQATTSNASVVENVTYGAVSHRLDSTVQAYSLISSALGLDMFKLGWSGMCFRIVQLLTQILIVVGFGWMLWKRKLYNLKAEYVAGCFVAFVLLWLCVLVPAFASLINATREYHVALFFVAPMFVVCFDAFNNVCKKT
jgi:uncharacterized membrane protein